MHERKKEEASSYDVERERMGWIDWKVNQKCILVI